MILEFVCGNNSTLRIIYIWWCNLQKLFKEYWC